MQNIEKLYEALEVYQASADKLANFNRHFIQLIQTYHGQQEHICALMMPDGSLNLTNFSSEIDKLDMLYDIYSTELKAFTKLPSKELLLLIAAAFDMYDDVESLLASAGYNLYMKNLNEFIIYAGICNLRSIDDIREKLQRYGYRGAKAMDSEHLFDYGETQEAQHLRDYVSDLCAKQGKKLSQVLKEAKLMTQRQDVANNRYINESLMGQRVGPIVLTKEQCVRLMDALLLDHQSRMDFVDFLSEGHFLMDKDDERLRLLIEDFDSVILQEPVRSRVMTNLNSESVLTTVLSHQAEKVAWEAIDPFILEHFGNIRSFAIFFDQVMDFEAVTLNAFAEKTGLKKTALYDYRSGLCVPDFEYLTVIASLLTRMNATIYKTLLKKAGKLEFGEYEQSPLLVIMDWIYKDCSHRGIAFGQLFDSLEGLWEQNETLMRQYQELYGTYALQCQIVAYKLMQSMNESQDQVCHMKQLLKGLKRQNTNMALSKALETLAVCIHPENQRVALQTLTQYYGFKQESRLYRAIESLKTVKGVV